MVMTKVIKEVLWLKSLYNEFSLCQDIVTIHCSSQSAIQLIKNQMYYERTKHIDVRYRFIREIIAKWKVSI
uniref:Retrovirus-related Pol polyprotein from transposon TNT 1-94 n=1 Tax=Rhizophora mucronata TaxID=61149 RepID=A0A2P2KFD6_RHIMU